jgi:NaMN:DMB phosphoribosyltransferase
LVDRGLNAAGLLPGGSPNQGDHGTARHAMAVLAAVGDPMQALAAGLCLGLAARAVPVVLAGGSQMAAVLALALALAPPEQRAALAAGSVIATTGWLAHDRGSNLQLLLGRIGSHWGVEPQLAVSRLRFDRCRSSALRDYERGYVKEGVGAGALAWLWELSGREPQALAATCDAAAGALQPLQP